jgi:hypothetical protein
MYLIFEPSNHQLTAFADMVPHRFPGCRSVAAL